MDLFLFSCGHLEHNRNIFLSALEDNPILGPTVHLGKAGSSSLIPCSAAYLYDVNEDFWLLLVHFDSTSHHLEQRFLSAVSEAGSSHELIKGVPPLIRTIEEEMIDRFRCQITSGADSIAHQPSFSPIVNAKSMVD